MFNDPWTCKDTVNVIISIASSILTAFVYEQLVKGRKERKHTSQYSFLGSRGNTFDWQHHDIVDGVIMKPINNFMNLTYVGNKSFNYEWNEEGKGIVGDGAFYWENLIHGKLYYHERLKHSFNYRNVFYAEVKYEDLDYDAIFVNADDENGRYAMLRLVSLRTIVTISD